MLGFGGASGDTAASQIISLVFTLLIVAIFVRARKQGEDLLAGIIVLEVVQRVLVDRFG